MYMYANVDLKMFYTTYKRKSKSPLRKCIIICLKSNQYSFNGQNTTTDKDAKVVYINPMLLDGRRTK